MVDKQADKPPTQPPETGPPDRGWKTMRIRPAGGSLDPAPQGTGHKWHFGCGRQTFPGGGPHSPRAREKLARTAVAVRRRTRKTTDRIDGISRSGRSAQSPSDFREIIRAGGMGEPYATRLLDQVLGNADDITRGRCAEWMRPSDSESAMRSRWRWRWRRLRRSYYYYVFLLLLRRRRREHVVSRYRVASAALLALVVMLSSPFVGRFRKFIKP